MTRGKILHSQEVSVNAWVFLPCKDFGFSTIIGYSAKKLNSNEKIKRLIFESSKDRKDHESIFPKRKLMIQEKYLKFSKKLKESFWF